MPEATHTDLYNHCGDMVIVGGEAFDMAYAFVVAGDNVTRPADLAVTHCVFVTARSNQADRFDFEWWVDDPPR